MTDYLEIICEKCEKHYFVQNSKDKEVQEMNLELAICPYCLTSRWNRKPYEVKKCKICGYPKYKSITYGRHIHLFMLGNICGACRGRLYRQRLKSKKTLITI